jgi:hypothetical protein
MTSAEKQPSGPLRPRNISVPSYRPTQRGGCMRCMRQFVSGSGEGQHTLPGATLAVGRGQGAGAHVQSTAQSSGRKAYALLGVHRRKKINSAKYVCSGSARACLVRRQARALRAPNPAETSAYQRPSGALTCNRRHAPASGPAPSTLCPAHVFSPVWSDTSGRPDSPAERARRLRRTPT